MKRTLLALLILGAGAVAFAWLSLLVNQSRTAAAHSRAECGRLTSHAKELAASATGLRAQVEAKQKRLNEASAAADSLRSRGAARVLSGGSSGDTPRLTPAELRQRLGIAWDNSPDYILVSKAALSYLYPSEIEHRGALTPTVCAVLGLTPEERATIEGSFQRAEAEHAAWVKTAVQRVEPAGDILADYRIPANPELARRLETEERALLSETLGPERAELVSGWNSDWDFHHGDLGENSFRFTVQRHADGRQGALWYQLAGQDATAGSNEAVEIKPGGPFPDLLRSVFPGGWRDLAQREGFALPKEFDEKSPEPQ